MPFVEVAGRNLFYERRGGGQPLLLIQGMSGHHRMWGEPLLSALADDFDVVIYDHRGIGESGWVDDPFTIADLADDAAGVITGLGWSWAHVFGISMGGMVAQQLALSHPDLVRSLSLGCSYAGQGGTLDAPGIPRLLQVARSGDEALVVRTMFEVNVSAAYAAEEANWARFRTHSRSVRVPMAVVAMQLQAAMAHDATARLADLRIPTLVMHGTRDQMLTYRNGEHLAEVIPDARLERFEGIGHLFWWEDTERAAALIRAHALDSGGS